MAGRKTRQCMPLPVFYLGGIEDIGEMAFKRGFRMDMKPGDRNTRHGNSPVFSNIKMPGLKKTSNVSLKKRRF